MCSGDRFVNTKSEPEKICTAGINCYGTLRILKKTVSMVTCSPGFVYFVGDNKQKTLGKIEPTMESKPKYVVWLIGFVQQSFKFFGLFFVLCFRFFSSFCFFLFCKSEMFYWTVNILYSIVNRWTNHSGMCEWKLSRFCWSDCYTKLNYFRVPRFWKLFRKAGNNDKTK